MRELSRLGHDRLTVGGDDTHMIASQGACQPGWPTTAFTHRSAKEDAMHPLFAELFLTPDDTLDADERRPLRRARRSRQLRTVSAARGKAGIAPTVLARHRAP